VVQGVKIEHVCGDPSLPSAADALLRRRIVETALRAIQQPVSAPMLFTPS
jgi:hypothetical protein